MQQNNKYKQNICITCNNLFIPDKRNYKIAKYCSDKCRQFWQRNKMSFKYNEKLSEQLILSKLIQKGDENIDKIQETIQMVSK